MFDVVILLAGEFFGGFGGNLRLRPDLAVRVWVRAAHDRAFVFKNLHIGDFGLFEERGGFVRPGFDHGFGLIETKLGDTQIVARREADDFADARFGLGLEEAVRYLGGRGQGVVTWRFGKQRGKVVFEDKCAGVLGIVETSRAFVARSQIAGRVVVG